MTKNEMIDTISGMTGNTKKATEAFIAALTATVTTELQRGDEITLPGIGKFTAANRAARVGKNPKTGEPLSIAASVAPKFKASKTLKDALN